MSERPPSPSAPPGRPEPDERPRTHFIGDGCAEPHGACRCGDPGDLDFHHRIDGPCFYNDALGYTLARLAADPYNECSVYAEHGSCSCSTGVGHYCYHPSASDVAGPGDSGAES